MDDKELIEKYNARREEVRSFIHEAIQNIDGLEFLQIVEELASERYSAPKEIILSQAQIDALDEAQKQIGRGEFYTDGEANEMIDKWLRAENDP